MSEHTTELLPWMTEKYSHLLALNTKGKLAHAYLFGGQEGLGKLALARHFAHYLLCTEKHEDQPCGHCRECQLLAVGTHPDMKLIQPLDSSEIKIDQIRETIEFINKTSQRGGYKIVLIRPAETMNISSANALLKVLEEPSRNTLLILVSHQPALLMATIRSRCHSISFNRPTPAVVIPWLGTKNIRASAPELLRMANNLPLRALALADEDAVHDRAVLHDVLEKLMRGEIGIAEAAAACESYDLEDNIEAMMFCASDILAHNQTLPSDSTSAILDRDLDSLAANFRSPASLRKLHDFYRQLLKARQAVKSKSNPNGLLILESLFFNWSRTVN